MGLVAMDTLALVVLAALDARLLVGADVAIRSRGSFLAVDVRLAALEASDFLVRQGLVLDALLDALLLIDVALHVGLHALRRCRQRIAVDAVRAGGLDVAAGLVLSHVELRALGRAELAVLQVLRLQTIDGCFVLLQQRGFAGRDAAVLQAALDARLLMCISSDARCGGGLGYRTERGADACAEDEYLEEGAFHGGAPMSSWAVCPRIQRTLQERR